MGTVTIAIITGAVTGLTKETVVDSYRFLKARVAETFGAQSAVVRSVEELEKLPSSRGRQLVVREELANVRADEDPELGKNAAAFLALLAAEPGGEQHARQVAAMFGNDNANIQITGSDNTIGAIRPTKRGDPISG